MHRTAHQLGMRTTATMMFGVGETFEHRVNHFEVVRQLQEETGGFTAFIPWSFQPHNTALGGRGPVLIGSASEVAENMRDWAEETGIDGFNLAYALTPGTFADVADLVVPELQSRGLFKHDYAPGTFREKLFGRGPLLPPGHPAASVRRSAA